MSGSYLYRFRDSENFLNRKELNNLEIYFAPPEQLNDPLEHLRNVVWKGDDIAWDNLFKHYIGCFYSVMVADMTYQADIPMSPHHIPIEGLANELQTGYFNDAFVDIVDEIFKICELGQLIDLIVTRKRSIRRWELEYWLRMIHLIVYKIVWNYNIEHDLAAHMAEKIDLTKMNTKGRFDDWEEYARRVWSTDSPSNSTKNNQAVVGNELRGNVKGLGFSIPNPRSTSPNHRLLGVDFVKEYLAQLNRILHPKWYSASFSRDFTSSLHWSYYGDDHKGVCLVFKPTVVEHLRQDLRNKFSQSGDTVNEKFGAMIVSSDVIYDKYLGKIDFFRSIGHDKDQRHQDMWYSDDAVNRSVCAPDYSTDEHEQNWFTEYFDGFIWNISRKTEDWSYEKETRLIATGLDIAMDRREDRLLQYQFDDLHAIIFGMNTPLENIRSIVDSVERLCRAHNRSEFVYERAYYCFESMKIRTAAVDLKGNSI